MWISIIHKYVKSTLTFRKHLSITYLENIFNIIVLSYLSKTTEDADDDDFI